MTKIEPEDIDRIAETFNISATLTREIVYTNDDDFAQYRDIVEETPEHRYTRVLDWVRAQIIDRPE